MSVAAWQVTLTFSSRTVLGSELEWRGFYSGTVMEALREALAYAYERFDIPSADCTSVRIEPHLEVCG